jgi:hypothetical protein
MAMFKAGGAVLCALMVGAAGCGGDKCDTATDPACGEDGPPGPVSETGEDTDTEVPGPPENAPYLYTLIVDESPGSTSGIDLDAIALVQGGVETFATEVLDCRFGPGEGLTTNLDCDQALGAPDNVDGMCDGSDDFYVNLGGVGGTLVVAFDGLEIAEGDIVRVYECGGEPDPYSVRIGTTSTVTAMGWVECVTFAEGVTECTVPELPDVPAE